MFVCVFKFLKVGCVASLVIAATSFSLFAPAQAAISRCGLHADVVKLLENRYGETQRSVGLISDTNVMQVFVSHEKGTWSIVMTNRSGQACLLAAGKDWEDVKRVIKKVEKGA